MPFTHDVYSKMDNTSNSSVILCEKPALKIHRLPRVSLKRRLNTERNYIELTCKGELVHPHSWINWYVNNKRITEWNEMSSLKAPENLADFFKSEIQKTIILDKMDRSLQGEFYCEFGGSKSVPRIASNKITVLFREGNHQEIITQTLSIYAKNGDASHDRIQTMLQTIRNCETSNIKMETVHLFQSRKDNLSIVVHLENYGKDNIAWTSYKTCLHNAMREYREMEYILKEPFICWSETIEVMDRNSERRTLEWPTTTLNDIAEPNETCITENGNIIKRKCTGDFIHGAFWEQMNYDCYWVSSNRSLFLESLSKNPVSKENLNQLTEELWNLNKKSEPLYSIDIRYIAKVMEKISEINEVTQKAIVNIASVVDHLMNTNESTLNTANNCYMSSSSITKSFEKILSKSVSSIRIDKPTFYAESIVTPLEEFVGISCSVNNPGQFDSKQVKHLNSTNIPETLQATVALILPRNFQSLNDVSFIIYNDSRMFPCTGSAKINSLIVSATVNRNNYTLDYFSPVKLIFQPFQMESLLENIACVFWDYSLHEEGGGWSDQGCWLDEVREGKFVCLCLHLTHFAVLMDVGEEDRALPMIHGFHLEIISYIGCALSILGLSLTIITFTLFKPWRKKMGNKVLCNFSVALLLVMVIFLGGIDKVNNPKTCLTVAVLLHYFLLATFGWMLVEGILHYLLFVRIYNSHVSRFMLKSMIVAWGYPLIIIAIVLSIDVDLYKGNTHYCWMSRTALIYSFLLPIGIIIVLNTIIFVLVIRSISCDSKNISGRKRSNFRQIVAAICIMMLLGLTWVFGFLIVDELRIFFQYLFCICNSCQGFLIFTFLVIRDNNAQDLWIAFLSKRKKSSTTDSSFPKRTKNIYETMSLEQKSVST